MPEELREQIPVMEELLAAMDVPIVQKDTIKRTVHNAVAVNQYQSFFLLIHVNLRRILKHSKKKQDTAYRNK